MNLAILYRGPLSSCNFGCAYCPFAKVEEEEPALARDRAALARFVDRVEALGADFPAISVFFTPWGEGLVRPWYGAALARLSRMPHVPRAAIQTNLSGPLGWLDDADRAKIGLWATYHPEWNSQRRFLSQVEKAAGTSLSVGVVGLREHYAAAAALRAALPPEVYLWVNAYKREPGYYTDAELDAWTAIDPHFRTNLVRWPSRGKPCRTGHTVISVDGDGAIRRCHFVKDVIGDLYAPDLGGALRPRLCPNDTCSCHIGYVHLEELRLDELYGAGLLERVPSQRATSHA